MRRRSAPFPLPLLLAAALAACARPEPAPEPVRAVRTLTVEAGQAGGVHEFAAEVRPRVESRLGFRVGGKLLQRPVEPGQRVRAGQVLAQLDPQDLRLGQASAQAAERAAEASAQQAEADLRRFRELRDQGFISAAELDRRESGYRVARAQLEQLRAQAGVQGNQAAYSTLVAPAAGVVTAVEAEPGTVLAVGTPVVRLALDGPRDAVFSVAEDRVGEFRALLGREGALRVRPWGGPPPGTVGADGAPDASVPARVREVAAAADPMTRTFLVKADLGQAPLELGQTATALVPLPRREAVATLPLPAVVQHRGQTVAWLVDAATMTVNPRPIEVGGADGNAVVVNRGLQPGDVVVTAGTHTLTPGQKVRLWQGSVAPATASAAR